MIIDWLAKTLEDRQTISDGLAQEIFRWGGARLSETSSNGYDT